MRAKGNIPTLSGTRTLAYSQAATLTAEQKLEQLGISEAVLRDIGGEVVTGLGRTGVLVQRMVELANWDHFPEVSRGLDKDMCNTRAYVAPFNLHKEKDVEIIES